MAAGGRRFRSQGVTMSAAREIDVKDLFGLFMMGISAFIIIAILIAWMWNATPH